LLFLLLSSSYTATWSYLRTSARKQRSESVGHIVAEETCSFGVRSGFQTFSKLFPKTFSKLYKLCEKIGFGKKFGKKWFSPGPENPVWRMPAQRAPALRAWPGSGWPRGRHGPRAGPGCETPRRRHVWCDRCNVWSVWNRLFGSSRLEGKLLSSSYSAGCCSWRQMLEVACRLPAPEGYSTESPP
jgi:hypothetical protein